MKKKKVLIVLTVFLLVAVVIILLMNQLSYKIIENPVVASLPKYDSSDCYYSDGFQDYTDFRKYYYREQKDIIEGVEESQYFKSVTTKDIEELKSYFDNFEKWLEYVDYKDEYDFQKEYIDTTDYFYIENKDTSEKYTGYPDKYSAYNVYFFDMQTKILFFIHSSI